MNRHAETTRQLEEELQATRARIDERAARLEEQLDPSALVDRAWAGLRSSEATDFFRNLGRVVRDNPVPVVLTGAGLAWLAASSAGDEDDGFDGEGSPSGEGLGRRTRAKLSSARSSARRRASRARSKLSGAASGARQAASDARANLEERGRDARHEAMAGVERVQAGWDELVEEQPLLVGLLGVVAGALLGATLPPTRTEDELLGETSDDLMEDAARRAREGVEQARDKVREASPVAHEREHSAASEHEERSARRSRPDVRSTPSPGIGT